MRRLVKKIKTPVLYISSSRIEKELRDIQNEADRHKNIPWVKGRMKSAQYLYIKSQIEERRDMFRRVDIDKIKNLIW